MSLFLLVGLSPGRVFAEGFAKDVPYQEAVPAFLEAITEVTEQLKDEQELTEIAQWEEDTRLRIQEFMDDLIEISMQLEDLDSYEEIWQEYSDFVDKWTGVINGYPGIDELDPVITSLLEELFDGLPTPREALAGDVPFANYHEWYREMEAENPWGLGAFFRIEPLLPEETETRISEITHEQRIEGIETITIIHKETSITRNGIVVFFEVIENDVIIDRFVLVKDPTLIHELLRVAHENDLDPLVIQGLDSLVNLIDEQLLLARDNGVLDEEVYNIMYGLNEEIICTSGICHQLLQNQITSDPLSASLVSGDLKTVSEAVREEKEEILMETYSNSVEDVSRVWFLGIFSPVFIFSVGSVLRLGLPF